MRRYITVASALALTLTAAAQNLNPTVQVTNAYDGKLMDISKKEIAMDVPDSLFRFDWDFNYSVFDSPYKGAYEFNPYVIDMRPDPVRYDGNRLYMRAGLGYTLHPEAQIVWNPMLKGRMGLSIYDDFQSYFGPYSDVSAERLGENSYKLHKGGSVSGSDMRNRLGAVLRYDLPKAVISFDTGLDYIRTGAADSTSCAESPLLASNSVFMNRNALRLKSNNPVSPFTYDLSARFSVLTGTASAAPAVKGAAVNEMGFGGDARLGYSFTANHGMALQASADRYMPGNSRVPSATLMEVTPMYSLFLDRLHFEAGVRVSKLWRQASESEGLYNPDSSRRRHGRLLYPHIKLDYELIDDALVVSAGVTGGRKYHSYMDYLSSDHRFSAYTSSDVMSVLSRATVNDFDASLGLSGRISHRLQFKLDGGYARVFNSPMQGLGDLTRESPFRYGYDMADYDMIYGDLGASWVSDRLEITSDMRFQKTDLQNTGRVATPAPFSGHALVRYNWNKRVYAGVSAEWATSRSFRGAEKPLNNDGQMPDDSFIQHYSCLIPGWVDLGISTEYRINSRLGVWAKGSNLLNHMVMRNLMVAERGLSFTVGASMSF